MSFELAPLPWAKDALEPVISKETIDYHYGKHHRAYVDKLNGMIGGTPHEGDSLQALVLGAEGALFNNAAQVWNHDFYWQCLGPEKTRPNGDLASALKAEFGTAEAFQEAFSKSALGNFGSGWTWLVLTLGNTLKIVNTDDADNPMRKGHAPLLTLDVWEHAYYIDYRNDRGRYLESAWQLINWDFVAENLAKRALPSAA
jgi:Fe-Mn family superoxide dismutase